ncbi:hypothetical protein [Roseomonas indoligenes]|uniref:Uncharacterized protein n=1 Tax=Roseomonas indoligenes TaxID=2820811 RepID=A0A940MZ85_9PROT|nr:hypothetical protein [Pararoseomonas indoligenes]MBP0494348.1 hypothetical protein [Pararoseomonas indoligenes]
MVEHPPFPILPGVPLSQGALHDAARQAARDMAAFCGLDMRHFRYPGRERDPAYEPATLAESCEVVDLFGALGPGNGRHGRDEALHGRIEAAYGHRVWVAHYKALNAAFLAHGEGRSIPSPLSGRDAQILGSVPIQHLQLMPCLDGDRLILHIGIGYMPVGLFYPAERLFLVLTGFGLNMRGTLRSVLEAFLKAPLPWAEWLRRALRKGLRRAFLIGDNRPSHYIRQTLAYLDEEEGAILGFAEKGGMIAVAPDLCAMDPFAVFPSLAPLDRLSVHSERLTEAVLVAGLDAHRVYRFNRPQNGAWLRRRLQAFIEAAPATPPGRFRVMISLDAERQRVVNAVEAFRYVLGRLGSACAASGRELEVVWDGWTVSGPPTAHDREVMGRIEGLIAAITEGLEVPLAAQFRIFGASALEKVPVLAGCGLAVTTRGAGAMISSWLLRRPTITYRAPANDSSWDYMDRDSVTEMDPAAIGEPPADDPLAARHRRFTLALWGLEEAMGRALEGQLTLPPVQPLR